MSRLRKAASTLVLFHFSGKDFDNAESLWSKTPEGKANSSRNATRHGLTSMHPVVTETDRPEFEALQAELRFSLAPTGFLQELTYSRILISAWNMQRVLKLENALLEQSLGEDPLNNPDTEKQAALYQRYYARFEGSYRANLRELERLQRLHLISSVHFQDTPSPLGELHDLQIIQRAQRDAKRNEKSQPEDENFTATILAELARNPDLAKRIREQRDQFTKR